jgi:hypothetical protein
MGYQYEKNTFEDELGKEKFEMFLGACHETDYCESNTE